MRHVVKSWKEFYRPIDDGSKPFDVRADDRGYTVGDTMLFREWEDRTGIFTGRQCSRTITYILKGEGAGAIAPLCGIARGYVVLGLKEEPR